jgi:carbon-monoxide dehydrogenase large subunit
MTTSVSAVGGTVRRREDPALIQGLGTYVDDMSRAGGLTAAFVRSPFAHARITSIDTTPANRMDGVRAVYTIEDVREVGPLLAQVPVGKLRPLLADGQVNHVGEAVAMVVADTPSQAQDAVEAVVVEYQPMEAVVDLKDAATDRVKVHDDEESNVLMAWQANQWWVMDFPDPRPEIEAAKERSDVVVVSQEMINQRLIPVPIEPRAIRAEWDAGSEAFTLYSSTQVPHAVAAGLATMLGLASNQVRVVAPEVGGGFGVKLNFYPDEVLACIAARDLGRPVHWTEARREAASSSIQGRGWIGTATLTGTTDGKILGYELDALADMGAYTQSFTVAIPLLGLFVAGGQYGMPTWWNVDLVQTNKTTTDAYRGAGRPEAIYYLERIIDIYAREIGMDPAAVRKKNFRPPEDFPVQTQVGLTMDSGEYAHNLDALLEAADYTGLREMQAAARAEGRLVGIGLSTYVEVCGFGPSILAETGFSWTNYGLPTSFSGSGIVRVNPSGSVDVITGTGPSGQGHKTTWSQIVSGALAMPMDQIRVHHGDSKEMPNGVGTFGSRSIAVDGGATWHAADRVRDKAAKIAAHLLEASADDIRFVDGSAQVAGSPDQSVTWPEIANAAYKKHLLPEGMEPGLEATITWDPGNATWPFGSQLAVVEVDPDTGNVEILQLHTMDDCGNQVNPMIVGGQVHGGVVQGIGQALFEEAIYDDAGNLLSGSLLDYPIPTAGDVPSIHNGHTTTPSDVNPMGVKGIGEAGTIGSAQTLVNAVVDALAPMGITHIDMPLRPKKVWQAMQDARG